MKCTFEEYEPSTTEFTNPQRHFLSYFPVISARMQNTGLIGSPHSNLNNMSLGALIVPWKSRC